jgi:hypothetical protein
MILWLVWNFLGNMWFLQLSIQHLFNHPKMSYIIMDENNATGYENVSINHLGK